MTKWWKCDLQIATPAWHFSFPPNSSYDMTSVEGRAAFADDYFLALRAKKIEVVALADHNTGAWIDLMVDAGKRHDVTVFPGCEITTGSGADGAHLLIIGDRSKTGQDFDRLLEGVVGFHETDHPRYHDVAGQKQPGSSGNTVLQILDNLPESYLAVAPHVLTDNGLASQRTAKGDIRWKALNHARLAAADPGDCSNQDGEGFNGDFRRRALDHFPRLKTLAFIATSDAYSIDALGSRFCWIRMEVPTLEGLRQAFLDHDARILCDWDPRLMGYHDRNPNNIRHGWVETIELSEILGGTTHRLNVQFHSGLNVLIGGRGSGKSTVVSGLRQLYAGYDTLPNAIRVEAHAFADSAFSGAATLTARHAVSSSQERHDVSWQAQMGRESHGATADALSTSFRVRVVNQKELYARVATNREDPQSHSRSLLAFVDESLGLLRDPNALPGTWSRQWDDAVPVWVDAARAHHRLKIDLAQLPSVRANIATLDKQLDSFDSEGARNRRAAFDRAANEAAQLDAESQRVIQLLKEVERVSTSAASSFGEAPISDGAEALVKQLKDIEAMLRETLTNAVSSARASLAKWATAVESSEWRESVRASKRDEEAYLSELEAQGLSPDAYTSLKVQLGEQIAREKTLLSKGNTLAGAEHSLTAARQKLDDLLTERRQRREALFRQVEFRSGRLRFVLRESSDTSGWVSAVRTLLNLRTDGFLEDVPELAQWLWIAPTQEEAVNRFRMWQDALVSGDLSIIAKKSNADMRPTWQKRIEELDEAIRLRLATEIADDAVGMSFLRDGGNPTASADWQEITSGSPGQRTAAMLAFVLHHGDEPLVLDQPEDDLDTEWLSDLVVKELRASRWRRQLIVVSHNANIPVNGDAERVIVLENCQGELRVRTSLGPTGAQEEHCGAIEVTNVRQDIQNIMEGGIRAFQNREHRYNSDAA